MSWIHRYYNKETVFPREEIRNTVYNIQRRNLEGCLTEQNAFLEVLHWPVKLPEKNHDILRAFLEYYRVKLADD